MSRKRGGRVANTFHNDSDWHLCSPLVVIAILSNIALERTLKSALLNSVVQPLRVKFTIFGIGEI